MNRKHERWISDVEKTHLKYLPVNKAIKNVSYEIKEKFWIGLLKIFMFVIFFNVSIYLIFDVIYLLVFVLSFIFPVSWWIKKWNNFLKLYAE